MQASIETSLLDPTGSLLSSSVSLEEASSARRVYLVTFPSDLGDVATIVGYGDSGSVASVTVTEEIQGAVQVKIEKNVATDGGSEACTVCLVQWLSLKCCWLVGDRLEIRTSMVWVTDA